MSKISPLSKRIYSLALMIVIALLVSTLSVQADETTPTQNPARKARIEAWQNKIDAAEQALHNDFKSKRSSVVESDLVQVMQQAKQSLERTRKQIASNQDKLDRLKISPRDEEKEEPPISLGMEPDLAEDESSDTDQEVSPDTSSDSAEEAEITSLRQELERTIARDSAHLTRVDLVLSQAQDLMRDISSWKQAWVRSLIFKRGPVPLKPAIWQDAASDGKTLAKRVFTAPVAWWHDHQEQGKNRFELIWLLPLLGLLIGWPARHLILKFFGRNPDEMEPSYARRLWKCSADTIANAFMPVAIIILVVTVMFGQGILTGLFGYLVYSIAAGSSGFLLVFGLARTALSPRLVQWRILPVEPGYTLRLLYAVATVLLLLTISSVILKTAWHSKLLTPEFESVFYLIQLPVTALALIWLLNPGYWTYSLAESQELGTASERAETLEGEEEASAEQTPNGPPTTVDHKDSPTPIWVRLLRVLRLLMIPIPFLVLAGYGRLGFHLQSRLVFTGAVLGVTFMLNLVLKEALEHAFLGHRAKRRQKRGQTSGNSSDSDMDVRVLIYWTGLGINILLMIPAIALLLLSYGVPWLTLKLWTYSLLSGITIGSITISLADILVAVLVLVVGIFITSLIRRWVARRVLPNTRLDTGARNSIAAGTSYLGIALTLLFATVTVGIDFSSLAMVAGALSVGIGFGLQNVVQNFAAGILLLIERPVKPGDWIQVGATEGSVKRMSVRFTEVETFDRSSVFVPNSDLISNQVVNWTYDNRKARLTLPVHVACDNDPGQIEKILLQCARKQRHVLWYPASYVWFRGFADGVLNFELRVYINDSDYWIDVDHGLYTAINAAFRDNGIVTPVPQRDLFIRRQTDAVPQSRLEPVDADDTGRASQTAGSSGNSSASSPDYIT